MHPRYVHHVSTFALGLCVVRQPRTNMAHQSSDVLLLYLLRYANGADGDDSPGESAPETQPPDGSQSLQSNFTLFCQVNLCTQAIRCAGHDCGCKVLDLFAMYQYSWWSVLE